MSPSAPAKIASPAHPEWSRSDPERRFSAMGFTVAGGQIVELDIPAIPSACPGSF